jgi:hypothetical protein
MSFVVRRVEKERGCDLLKAWSINSIDGHRERTLLIVSQDEYPELNGSSQLVYVQGQKGSVCRNSGFLVNGGRSFIACNLG